MDQAPLSCTRVIIYYFFFKQKTAYEMRISDWSSDVCSADLHTAQHVSTVDEEMLTEGIMFDGSSIAGWKPINESDMNLNPDLSTAVLDPFTAQPQLILFCDVLEPSTGEPYVRGPRSTAQKALAYMESTGVDRQRPRMNSSH